MSIEEIARQFTLSGSIIQISPFGNGHIHRTYKVHINGPENYLLQKINKEVFKDVNVLMTNLYEVTNHLKKNGSYTHSLELVKTTKEEFYFQNNDDSWRMFIFLDDLKSYDLVKEPEVIYEGAKALGVFIKDLDGLEPARLRYPIPQFHNLFFRLEQLKTALKKGLEDRIHQCKKEIALVHQHAHDQLKLESLKREGNLPIRICHNDTKLNNVLFDENQKAQAVIDLDTVMPGIVHYDFGDGVRTACATANEDEVDLAIVGLDEKKLQAFYSGFSIPLTDILTKEEKATLPLSIPLFSFMQGVRFLTDYLLGDRYYQAKHEEHNLVRARNQLALFNESLRLKFRFK